MPIFILAEALLFIGFFAAYWVTRLSQGLQNYGVLPKGRVSKKSS